MYVFAAPWCRWTYVHIMRVLESETGAKGDNGEVKFAGGRKINFREDGT